MPRSLRVAALIDLPRSPHAGGHVKCWERLAAAAAQSPLPLDLTVYFSGEEKTEVLSEKTRIRQLPPLFSTARLSFLPYVPDHTDLAPFHPRLAKELRGFDLLHTTDGFFNFARTAEKTSRYYKIPLVTSFHTDTPSYARIFTRQTLERLFGTGWFGRKLIEDLKIPERQERSMTKRLRQHVAHCKEALVTRIEDHALADAILGQARVHHMRLGVDRALFNPAKRDRKAIERLYNIPEDRVVFLFVGRLDIGKNIYVLIEAMESLIREGVPLHLVTAGIGPAAQDVRERLGAAASVPGFVSPENLAQLYASVDAVAMPSEVEIRSMAGVEALTAGCPALISEKSGMIDLFNHTPAMRPVASSVSAWREALCSFAADPALRDTMRQTATAYSDKHLASWHDVLAEDLFAVWERLIPRAP